MLPITEKVYKLGIVDWDRTLFDAFVPTPQGTSYNSYLVKGKDKTVLIDTSEPKFKKEYLAQLKDVKTIDYIITNHAEQDHSGCLPFVLDKYPKAKIITNAKAKTFLLDLLHLDDDQFIVIQDGETFSIGDKTFEFIFAPWVHWPETMFTYLQEDKILFTCDLFGAHLATSSLFSDDKHSTYLAAKRYYSEIMMPFRKNIQKYIKKIDSMAVDYIAPSHGPVHNDPQFILNAYKKWTSDSPKNLVILPYISMHGSVRGMVNFLADELIKRKINIEIFNLEIKEIGDVATALVDAATIVVGSPTVYTNAHPVVVYYTYFFNMQRLKTKFFTSIGSYNWATQTPKTLNEIVQNSRFEILPDVHIKGILKKEDFDKLINLANIIEEKHKSLGLL